MKRSKILLTIGAITAVLCLLAATSALLLFTNLNHRGKTLYIFIDHDDSVDSVYAKIYETAAPRQTLGLKFAAALLSYPQHLHTGKYALPEKISPFTLVRKLRGRMQEPVELVVTTTNTVENLAAKLATKLEADSATLAQTFLNPTLLEQINLDSANIIGIFIPNTYEVYWDIAPEDLLLRFKRESDAFWTPQRQELAQLRGLSPQQVLTLASIVEKETANNAEKPQIAAMYLNRLAINMKLQADPTVKFALRNFTLRRILHDHLRTESPYNTYLCEGLPPGPICNPAPVSIEAVLRPANHNFLYMCANPDFTGTHLFATTYGEHLRNAKNYAKALDERGIKAN